MKNTQYTSNYPPALGVESSGVPSQDFSPSSKFYPMSNVEPSSKKLSSSCHTPQYKNIQNNLDRNLFMDSTSVSSYLTLFD